MNADVILKYGKAMAELPYDVGGSARLFLKDGDRIFATSVDSELGLLSEEDIVEVTDSIFPEIMALHKMKKVGGMIMFKTPYVGECMERGEVIPAALDDMAQIVGHRVNIVSYDEAKIVKAINQSAVVMIKDDYALAVGRDLYEAFVAMTVIEKSAEVFLKAIAIGGVKTLNSVEAKVMRMVYLRKYSAAERKAKDESEG